MPLEFWTHYWAFTSFVFGAIVGSFLNVCIWRLPRGESLADPPSHCPNCNHRLRMLPDMVPILSQLWYRSRCRYCNARFSWRYMWVEVFTAVAFTAVYYQYYAYSASGMPEDARLVPTLCGMAFVAALITLFFIDLEHFQIPDVTILVAVLAGVVKDGVLIYQRERELFLSPAGWAFSLPLPLSILGGLVAFWLLWQFAALATALMGREAMGAGDSLLLGAMGTFLIPWPLVLVAFLFAIGLGTVGGLVGLWVASRQDQAIAASPLITPTDGEAATAVARPEGEPEEESGPDEPPFAAPEPEGEASDLPSANEGQDATTALFAPEPPLSEAGIPSVEGAPVEDTPVEAEPVVDAADEEAEVPLLPPASRWGRLWTVAGTWVALGAIWGGVALYRGSPGVGAGVVVVGLAIAVALLVFGIRQWVTGDREWLPAMDALFEDDPGPRFIPFGPYLVAGTLLAMFLGRPLIEWYATTQLGIPLGTVAGWGWD